MDKGPIGILGTQGKEIKVGYTIGIGIRIEVKREIMIGD